MTGGDRLDPRLTPSRPDLAAAFLEGVVAADRFVVGNRRVVLADVVDVRRQPRLDAPLETQAIHGESVIVFEEDEGWGWVQLEADGYVGYVALHALTDEAPPPTHVVSVNRTFVYTAPDIKRVLASGLTLGARVAVVGVSGAFATLATGGYVFAPHLVPLDDHESDFVAVAERLAHTPYMWGGKSSLGIDCSGLVQLALARSGLGAPRDTDMQEEALGEAVSFDAGLDGLRRGDLVFWRGHVGIMRDADRLIHANAHHMSVETESLREAVRRIEANSKACVTSIRRLIP